jgi:hypothetical protein
LATVAISDAAAGIPGSLSAFACGELPSPLLVEVGAQDDSRQSRRLKNALIKALTDRRTEFAADAPLKISLHVKPVREGARYKARAIRAAIWVNSAAAIDRSNAQNFA